ncbi:CHASE2 domain-containing protein [Desulfonauticus submarinus]
MLRKNKFFLILSIIFLLFSFFLYFLNPSFLHFLDLKIFDLEMQLRGKIEPSGKVVIVAIDEKSLEKIGRWPWSRNIMAKLVQKIDSFQPKVVGYDISFFEPEKNRVQEELIYLTKKLKQSKKLDKELFAFLKQRILANFPDLHLATTFAKCKSKHILGYYFNFSTKDEKFQNLDKAFKYSGIRYFQDSKAKLFIPKALKVRHNIPLILKGAGKEAYFNVIPDDDGTFRRYPLTIKYNKNFFQPLAVAMYRADDARGSFIYVGKAGVLGVKIKDKFVSTDKRCFLYLNFRGREKSIPHIPAWKVLENKISFKNLNQKYVIVGVTAPGVYDLRVTPFGVAYPGVEIQATALDNFLKGDYLTRPSFASLFDLFSILILWILATVAILFLNPFYSLLVVAGVFFSYWTVNYYFLVKKLYVLNLVYPLLSLLITYLGLITYRILFADKQKRQLRQAFSKYLDPKVVDQVVKSPDSLRLGGEKRELSVLFSDIRGFTSLSEKLSPEELVSLLNEYLTEMTAIVLTEKGLLDKYIGDAIMAIFGTPLYYPDHALAACKAALKMLDRLKELNKRWKDEKDISLNIGIGINTGEMVAGNMGSLDRFDYTVMGDNVNLASRLEGLNKYYGTNILISEFTYNFVKDKINAREIDMVRVKGKVKPVRIYEVLTKEKSMFFSTYKEDYLKFLDLYYKGNFNKAKEIIEKLKNNFSEDNLLDVYINRLNYLLANPPKEWDGVYTFTVK